MEMGTSDDKNKQDRNTQPDSRADSRPGSWPGSGFEETGLIRPSGAQPFGSMDQFSYSYYNTAPPRDRYNILEIWRKVRKRKWLVLAIVVITMTIVTVEAFRTKALYQATAKIAKNEENPAVIKLGDAIIGTDDTERIKTDLLLL